MAEPNPEDPLDAEIVIIIYILLSIYLQGSNKVLSNRLGQAYSPLIKTD